MRRLLGMSLIFLLACSTDPTDGTEETPSNTDGSEISPAEDGGVDAGSDGGSDAGVDGGGETKACDALAEATCEAEVGCSVERCGDQFVGCTNGEAKGCGGAWALTDLYIDSPLNRWEHFEYGDGIRDFPKAPPSADYPPVVNRVYVDVVNTSRSEFVRSRRVLLSARPIEGGPWQQIGVVTLENTAPGEHSKQFIEWAMPVGSKPLGFKAELEGNSGAQGERLFRLEQRVTMGGNTVYKFFKMKSAPPISKQTVTVALEGDSTFTDGTDVSVEGRMGNPKIWSAALSSNTAKVTTMGQVPVSVTIEQKDSVTQDIRYRYEVVGTSANSEKVTEMVRLRLEDRYPMVFDKSLCYGDRINGSVAPGNNESIHPNISAESWFAMQIPAEAGTSWMWQEIHAGVNFAEYYTIKGGEKVVVYYTGNTVVSDAVTKVLECRGFE